MAKDFASEIDRRVASLRMPARRVLPLQVERMAPVIRIAHTMQHPLHILPRVIFDHELVLIRAGVGTLTLGAERFEFRAFDLFFIPPFVPHHFVSVGVVGSHSAVHFDLHPNVPAATGRHLRLGLRRPYEVRLTGGLALPTYTRVSRGHRVCGLFDHLVAAFAGGGTLGELEAAVDLLGILTALLRAERVDGAAPMEGAGGRMRARLERVIAHVHAKLAVPQSVEALAEVAGLSGSHFAMVFRQYTGYPPLEYVRRQRIARARQLLGELDLSIKEIAARVGFEDAFHFSRVFRQIDGLPPSQYREAVLASRGRS